jgi:ADP-ribosylation factor-like protein 5B
MAPSHVSALSSQSTILYRITMGSVVATAPTVGSNHEIYDYKGVRFGLIDIGGQTSLRSSWGQYFAGTTAIILVIDSSDAGRLPLAKAELQKLVADEVGWA